MSTIQPSSLDTSVSAAGRATRRPARFPKKSSEEMETPSDPDDDAPQSGDSGDESEPYSSGRRKRKRKRGARPKAPKKTKKDSDQAVARKGNSEKTASSILKTQGEKPVRSEPMVRSSNIPNSSNVRRLTLVQEGTFQFDKTTCSHELDECAVMKAYNLVYDDILKAIICRSHQKLLVPNDDLASHLTYYSTAAKCHEGVHNHASIRQLLLPIEKVVEHLHERFDLAPNPIQDVAKNLSLLQPIPSLPDPLLFVKCPDCHKYKKLKRSTIIGGKFPTKSWKSTHRTCSRRPLEEMIIRNVQPFSMECINYGFENYALYGVLVSPSWSPRDDGEQATQLAGSHSSAPQLVAPKPVEYEFRTLHKQPSYVAKDGDDEFGWVEALIGSSSCRERDDFVIGLTRIPLENPPSDMPPLQRLLEKRLFELHVYLRPYIENANKFVNDCNISLRAQITESMAGSFRSLSPQTYSRYRLPLTRAVAFLLRLELAKRIKADVFGFHCKITKTTYKARNELYDYMMDDKVPEGQVLDCVELGKRVHKLLVTLVLSYSPLDEKVGNAIDYATSIANYIGGGLFKPPSFLTQINAATSYSICSVAVHVIRVGARNAELTPFVSKKDRGGGGGDGDGKESGSNGEDCIPNLIPLKNDSGGGDGEESGSDGEDEDSEAEGCVPNLIPLKKASHIPVEEIIEDSPDDEDDETVDSLQCVVEYVKPFMSAREKKPDRPRGTTAAERNGRYWSRGRKECENVTGFSRTHWVRDGEALLYYDSQLPAPTELWMDDLILFVRKSIIRAKESLLSLLPPDFDISPLNKEGIQLGNQACSLDLASLKDDLHCGQSIVFQNDDMFSELSERVWQGLQKTFSCRDANRRKNRQSAWLAREQEFLEWFATAFMLTCGIPPRAFQAILLLFAPTSELPTNVFLLKGDLVITLPKTKSYTKEMKGGLWALPRELASIFLIYLGIFRRISVTLRKVMKIPGDLSIAESFIFIRPDKNQPWSGSEFSQKVRKLTSGSDLPFPLDPGRGRQVMKAIVHKFYPIGGDQDRAIRSNLHIFFRMADHSHQTSARNYGMDERAKLGGHFSDKEIEDFRQASQLWQSTCGLLAPNSGMSERLDPIAQARKHGRWVIAFMRARVLVMAQYGVGSRVSAEKIVHDRPFLQKYASCFGDEVLVQVAAAVCFGIERPAVTESIYPSGYPVRAIGEAISLIHLALAEWEHGDRRVYDLTNAETKYLVERMADQERKTVGSLKAENKEGWKEFTRKIYRYAEFPPSQQLESVWFKFNDDGKTVHSSEIEYSISDEAGDLRPKSTRTSPNRLSSHPPSPQEAASPRRYSSLPPDFSPSSASPKQMSTDVEMKDIREEYEYEGDMITPNTAPESPSPSPAPGSPPPLPSPGSRKEYEDEDEMMTPYIAPGSPPPSPAPSSRREYEDEDDMMTLDIARDSPSPSPAPGSPPPAPTPSSPPPSPAPGSRKEYEDEDDMMTPDIARDSPSPSPAPGSPPPSPAPDSRKEYEDEDDMITPDIAPDSPSPSPAPGSVGATLVRVAIAGENDDILPSGAGDGRVGRKRKIAALSAPRVARAFGRNIVNCSLPTSAPSVGRTSSGAHRVARLSEARVPPEKSVFGDDSDDGHSLPSVVVSQGGRVQHALPASRSPSIDSEPRGITVSQKKGRVAKRVRTC